MFNRYIFQRLYVYIDIQGCLFTSIHSFFLAVMCDIRHILPRQLQHR